MLQIFKYAERDQSLWVYLFRLDNQNQIIRNQCNWDNAWCWTRPVVSVNWTSDLLQYKPQSLYTIPQNSHMIHKIALQ